MDGEANLPTPHLNSKSNLSRPINFSSSSSSSSVFHKPSEPDFLRNVQAAFKRHRSIGTMQPTNLLPRRVPPQRATSGTSGLSSGLTVETKKSVEADSEVTGEAQEDASFTPPSISGTITNTYDEKCNPFGGHTKEDQPATNFEDVDIHVPSCVESKPCQMEEGSKKVKFSLPNSAVSQEMEWEAVNQAESYNVNVKEPKHQKPVSIDADSSVLRADGGSSNLGKSMSALQNQLHNLRNFLHTDGNHPMTQSSVVGSACATTTSVHATSAPILNSTTHSSCPNKDSSAVGSLAVANLKSQNIAQGDFMQRSCPASVVVSGAEADRALSGAQASSSATYASAQVKSTQESNLLQQRLVPTDASQLQGQSIKEKGLGADASMIPPPCLSSNLSSDAKLEPTKSEKQEKAPSRKKGYDPELFFKVNGKLYQRLGKIGSGGSSEVHKVISSDCTIYALKKIKLKGRDYQTAKGFCQEIVYLKKLKGKDNIIQLIDYEVSDKALLHEVLNDLSSNKDNKVKDDGYIYMVLEYGEIDLAHMLLQKWKEIERSNSTMDENWLRFYWQQILQAVNTIHEERIVHSDLKPANFLLVKGSLKLIDFGIAKAIMSDTTNIQRDAQVGTLSYMSPEAFLCNEKDADGNIIKCGRPSDIWSLGCILYQMVYGRTPFSEFKTFWAKFKVITDSNHEIAYGPVSNPWLLDLMKKCLAWDRNERWRIPQLLKHPFLVPPIHQHMSLTQDQNFTFIQLISKSCTNDEFVSSLCSELQNILGNQEATSRVQQVRLL